MILIGMVPKGIVNSLTLSLCMNPVGSAQSFTLSVFFLSRFRELLSEGEEGRGKDGKIRSWSR
jgi:hypothetical protein